MTKRKTFTRSIVVTAFTNGYDRLNAPLNWETSGQEWEVIALSNATLSVPKPWKLVLLPELCQSLKRNVLFAKTHLFDLFPDVQSIIWMDARLQLKVPLPDARLMADFDQIRTYRHPRHKTLNHEIREIEEEYLVPLDQLRKFRARLNPHDLHSEPHSETGMIAASRSDKVCEFFRTWWSQIEDAPYRDQLTFDRSVRMSGISLSYFENGDTDASSSELVNKGVHQKARPTFEKKNRGQAPRSSAHPLTNDLFGRQQELRTFGASRPIQGDPRDHALVMPLYGETGQTELCITSLLMSGFEGKIVLYGNGVSERLRTLASDFALKYSSISYHEVDGARGFALACNEAASLTSASLITFANSDIIFSHGWQASVLCCFEDVRVSVVGGLGVNTGDHSVAKMNNADFSKISWKNLEDIASFCQAWQLEHGPIWAKSCHGSLLTVRKEEFLDIGGFDDQRFPEGYGEEVDLCFRLRDRGKMTVVAPGALLLHYGAQSFGPRRSSLVATGKELLRERFGEDTVGRLGDDLRQSSQFLQFKNNLQQWLSLTTGLTLEESVFGTASG